MAKIAREGWKSWNHKSIAAGNVGITVDSNWTEMVVLVQFGENLNYGFTFFVTKEEVAQFANGAHLISGQYNGANDYNSVVVVVNSGSVTLERYVWSGSDYASSSPLHVFYH